VKVGNRQAPHSPLKTEQRAKTPPHKGGVFAFRGSVSDSRFLTL
jgi:hypothetical protein